MPELPEIEVLRRSLASRLPGRRIARIEVRKTDLRERIRPAELRRKCEGRRICGLRRRSKYLLMDLEGATTLVIHLGMSGRLTLAPPSEPSEPHEHLTFYLDRGGKLRFRDPRRFGLVLARSTARLEKDRHFAGLGVEPLDPPIEGRILAEAAVGRRGPIKTFLMNPAVVVGIGNIYACEVLYRAGVHPRRSVARMARNRWDRVAEAAVAVLGEAVRQGGTTLNDFSDGLGSSGYFQVSLAVYGREGEPCDGCGRELRRSVLSGRSTFYCPGCQR